MIRSFFRSTAPALAALLLASASVVSAQYSAERPGDRLSRYLRELAADPTSLPALIGAGQAAIDVGDGNAALGFFARADERSPRNGPVKAGLARALLMVDNPREALKMFDAARSLGVAEADLAGDRGLAYDLKGESRKAQHDYQLALTRGPNDEITKRYALSLGISGDRDQALKLIDPLLYKRDQGAWRARAFVLAMTGDTVGASRIVHQVMPERMAQTMDPFLMKLPALNAAQRAAAVHLGEMPNDVRVATAVPVMAQPAYVAPVPSPAPTPSPTPNNEVRQPHRTSQAVMLASPPPQKTMRISGRGKTRMSSLPAPVPTPTPEPPPPPVRVAQFEDPAAYAPRPFATPMPAPSVIRVMPRSAPIQRAQRGDLDAIMRDIRNAAASGEAVHSPAPVRLAQVTPRAAPAPKPTPTPTSKAKDEPARLDAKKGKALADVEECKPTHLKKGRRAAAKDECDATGAKKAKEAALKKKPELPKNPARFWVQVAGGANAGALPKEWVSLTAKTAELKGKGPWTAKNRATNRLLAGPYKSQEEAQAAVAKLRKAGVGGAFQWQSDEGEPVDKLGGK